MFEHIVHLQQLHIDFGATQVRACDLLLGNGSTRSDGAQLAQLTRRSRGAPPRLPSVSRLASPTATPWTAATMPAPPRLRSATKSSTRRATPSVATAPASTVATALAFRGEAWTQGAAKSSQKAPPRATNKSVNAQSVCVHRRPVCTWLSSEGALACPDGLVSCSHREDNGDGDSDFHHFQHNGGSQVNNYFHDFGHT